MNEFINMNIVTNNAKLKPLKSQTIKNAKFDCSKIKLYSPQLYLCSSGIFNLKQCLLILL